MKEMIDDKNIRGGVRAVRRKIWNFLQRSEHATYYWSIRMAALQQSGIKRYIAVYRHKKLMRCNCADIPLAASIADIPVFPHGLTGIFISSGASIGSGCTIFHQVTIGSNTLPDSPNRGVPIVGNNVYIGCGAKIIGNVRIGDNVRIGANCVVTKDIPANSTVVLSSPRLIEHHKIKENKFVPFGDYKCKFPQNGG